MYPTFKTSRMQTFLVAAGTWTRLDQVTADENAITFNSPLNRRKAFRLVNLSATDMEYANADLTAVASPRNRDIIAAAGERKANGDHRVQVWVRSAAGGRVFLHQVGI